MAKDRAEQARRPAARHWLRPMPVRSGVCTAGPGRAPPHSLLATCRGPRPPPGPTAVVRGRPLGAPATPTAAIGTLGLHRAPPPRKRVPGMSFRFAVAARRRPSSEARRVPGHRGERLALGPLRRRLAPSPSSTPGVMLRAPHHGHHGALAVLVPSGLRGPGRRLDGQTGGLGWFRSETPPPTAAGAWFVSALADTAPSVRPVARPPHAPVIGTGGSLLHASAPARIALLDGSRSASILRPPTGPVGSADTAQLRITGTTGSADRLMRGAALVQITAEEKSWLGGVAAGPAQQARRARGPHRVAGYHARGGWPW